MQLDLENERRSTDREVSGAVWESVYLLGPMNSRSTSKILDPPDLVFFNNGRLNWLIRRTAPMACFLFGNLRGDFRHGRCLLELFEKTYKFRESTKCHHLGNHDARDEWCPMLFWVLTHWEVSINGFPL